MKKTKRGFTMIELSLAILFISIMLVAMTVIIYNVMVIYQKGLSMRAVNSGGRELVDEFSRAISSSPTTPLATPCNEYSTDAAKNACKSDNARAFLFQQKYGTVKINDVDRTVPLHGAFCTGRYSYIWNTGYALNSTDYPLVSGHKAEYHYVDASGTPQVKEDFRLLKIPDTSRTVCLAHTNYAISGAVASYGYSNDSYKYSMGGSLSTEFEELLENSEDNLALYDFVVFKPTQHTVTLHSFYSGTFILATLKGSVDITGPGEFCTAPPDGLRTDFTYCAINKFNFAMRAEGQLQTGE